MNVDQAPVEALLLVALICWALLGALHLHHSQRVRRDDRDAERRALRVLEQCREHRPTDHDVQQPDRDQHAEQPADDDQEPRVVHARRVAA